MIAYLKGKLVHKEPAFMIVDVNGIGYEVMTSLQTFARVKDKEDCKIFTYLHVREDAQILYGFADETEKQMFKHLISVNGIGPNTAMVVLSFLPPDDLKLAIIKEDQAKLQAVKGIGGKTAQRLILELKDKLRKDTGVETSGIHTVAHNTKRQEALSALTMLGINKVTAERNIDTILKKSGEEISLEELVKQALKNA